MRFVKSFQIIRKLISGCSFPVNKDLIRILLLPAQNDVFVPKAGRSQFEVPKERGNLPDSFYNAPIGWAGVLMTQAIQDRCQITRIWPKPTIIPYIAVLTNTRGR